MNQAYYNFQFGTLKMQYEDETLYHLEVTTESIKQNQKNEFTDKIFKEIEEYLKGQRKSFDITYKLEGTKFQKNVWKVLEEIPYGKTYTYLDIAKKINNPKSARAVGGACNKNPIWLIVPCHRVIGTNGKLVGYAGGLNMKQKLLQIEANYYSK